MQEALLWQSLKQFEKKPASYDSKLAKDLELNFYNGLGGFGKDGKEYVIFLENGQNTPLPWINVISNQRIWIYK